MEVFLKRQHKLAFFLGKTSNGENTKGAIKMREKAQIMNREEMQWALRRISHEILEHNKGVEDLVIVGIKSRGDNLGHRIAQNLEQIEKKEIPVGVVDIQLYRDDIDLFNQIMVNRTDIPFEIDKKHIILVDDVLFHGRTIRAAMDALMDFGRPATIQLAVLVDRGHRELPIEANYVGKNIPTSRKEWIQVYLKEIDGEDRVVICGKDDEE